MAAITSGDGLGGGRGERGTSDAPLGVGFATTKGAALSISCADSNVSPGCSTAGSDREGEVLVDLGKGKIARSPLNSSSTREPSMAWSEEASSDALGDGYGSVEFGRGVALSPEVRGMPNLAMNMSKMTRHSSALVALDMRRRMSCAASMLIAGWWTAGWGTSTGVLASAVACADLLDSRAGGVTCAWRPDDSASFVCSCLRSMCSLLLGAEASPLDPWVVMGAGRFFTGTGSGDSGLSSIGTAFRETDCILGRLLGGGLVGGLL